MSKLSARPIQNVLANAAVASAYFGVAFVILHLRYEPNLPTPVYLPSGVAWAAAFAFGPRVLPGTLIGAFASSLYVGLPPAGAFGAALFSTTEAAIGGYLLRPGQRLALDLDRVGGVFAFIFPVVAFTGLGSGLMTLAGWMAGRVEAGSIVATMTVVWFARAAGVVVAVGTVASWLERPFKTWTRRQWSEAVALACVIAAVAAFVFSRTWTYPPLILALPPVVWSAIRFRKLGATTATFIHSAVAIVVSYQSFTQLQAGSRELVIALELGIGIHVAVALLIAAALAEREHVQVALTESEERYRRIVQTANEGLWQTDENEITTFVNDKMGRMLGYAADDMIGRPASDFMIDSSKGMALESLERRSHGTTEAQEFQLAHRDGSAVWTLLSTAPVFDDAGVYRGVIAMASDISQRKRVDAARASLELQLRQAQKMEAVGRLAGGVAHDFNNLLAVIVNYADFMADGLDVADPRMHDVQQIRKAADRGAKLIRELMAFSRDEMVDPQVVSLNALIADMRTLLERTLGENVHLEIQNQTDLWLVEIDTSRIEQALINLMINARDAMPRGGAVTIRTANTSVTELAAAQHPGLNPGRYACMEVGDTGFGMNEDVRSHIFDPFFTTKPRDKGTGLGLSVVYGIMKKAGGYISVESQPGEGTTFRLCFPATEKPATVATRPAPEILLNHGLPDGHHTVLVVEDQDGVRELVARILKNSGYSVLAAPSADAAMVLLQEEGRTIDLLLTDVVMPGMSGKALAQVVRTTCGPVPTLYMSGYTDEIVRSDERLQSDERFIPKPFDANELLHKVEEVLSA